ncbi:FAD synthase [uncultured archaeon]|nr:FAD synthase [uncultured archaeon]HKJ96902.1 adenylyltransferase/cytidyltransferase family protein [Thermoplasmataceae archaeon]
MTRVMATGVFDIIHLGHIHYLRESGKLGDELVVVVARDSTAKRNSKDPLFNEDMRLQIVSELKIVDKAILGHEGDIFATVREVGPDIITLGYDQHFDPKIIEDRCREMGLDTKVVRVSKYSSGPFEGSSQIRKKLLENIEREI